MMIAMPASASTPTSAAERLIIALDVPNAATAGELIRQIGEAPVCFKVGLQLFLAEGPEFVRQLTSAGKRVFLDLKLHDIPNTVASAVRSACELQVHMLTLHAGGGSAMLRAAAEAAKDAATRPLLLGVTVLTSMDEAGLIETGVAVAPSDQVSRLAILAINSGCDGVIASPQEVALLRRSVAPQSARDFSRDFVIVTPGVRPAGADKGDQSRIATPGEAIRAGADYLVVGRPITAATDPRSAAEAIIAEMQRANH